MDKTKFVIKVGLRTNSKVVFMDSNEIPSTPRSPINIATVAIKEVRMKIKT